VNHPLSTVKDTQPNLHQNKNSSVITQLVGVNCTTLKWITTEYSDQSISWHQCLYVISNTHTTVICLL